MKNSANAGSARRTRTISAFSKRITLQSPIALAVAERRSCASRLGNLRLRNMKDWERVVIRLARRTPFIVLDSRNPSQAVVTETARILENPSLMKKTLFVVDEGGAVESDTRVSPARTAEPLNTTKFDTLVADLRRIGLPKTASPDDNPVLRQMMFDEHSKKLGFQMRAIQWLIPPLVFALKNVERYPQVRRRGAVRGIYFDDTNPDMAADAGALLHTLGENPAGGALAILATLDRDVAYLGDYVEKWSHAREPHQRRLWLRVRAMYDGMLKLQRLRDLAPVSFAKMNTDALRALR
ncbi:MAG: hypothetical protein ABL883_07405 [Terricaulis sp.]